MIPKKIAILCDYKLLPERIGGMDHFFWAFQKKCTEEGIKVDWFFPNASRHEGYVDFNIISAENSAIEKRFIAYCKEHTPNYDVVVTHFLELCTSFFKEAKISTKAKIIAVDHNPRPLGGYKRSKKVMKKIKGHLYSGFIDVVVGVSDYTGREIIQDFGKHLAKKTITVYNGVIIDHIKVQESRNHSNPKFIVASHLRASKGIQDLIAAVALLDSVILKSLVIDIYGDGPYRANLEQLVTSHNLNNVFHFMGNSPTLNETYAAYDYMLQPTYMECFSLSILESLAANVPVITTNVGGNEEAVTDGENGFIFEAKDIDMLKAILKDISTGKQKITTNTRKNIAQNFTIDKMVENHFELILS